jgi:acetyl esterase/lipase
MAGVRLVCRLAGLALLATCSQTSGAPVKTQNDHLILRPGSVLIEGEETNASNFRVDTLETRHVAKQGDSLVARRFPSLSKGAASLLCTRARPDSAYFARYQFKTAAAFKGVLWTLEQGRAWSSPFQWRIDTGAWNEASVRVQMERWLHVADDGPTFAWSQLGSVDLKAGTHTLELRVSEPRKDGLFLLSQDCFVMVKPSGDDQSRPFAWAHEAPGGNAVMLWGAGPVPGSDVDIGFRPWMEPYLVKTSKPVGAVLVCPGGAYVGRAPSEGENVAKRFNKAGYNAFVVYYRTSPHRHPAPFMDASRALRIIRSRAGEWKVDPHHIAVCGFSAGGHLAASLGVHFGKWLQQNPDSVDRLSGRPDALILCYPVITAPPLGHRGSFANLLGENPKPELVTLMSLEQQVSDSTPPAFLWHTAPDDVKVENSLLFAGALSKHKVPFEIHVFHKGPHGLNIAEDDPHVGSWVNLCCQWLDEMGWKQEIGRAGP